MTTVAVTDKQLATDSQATRAMTAMPSNFQKIFTPEEDKEYWEVNGVKIIAFGLCGNYHAADFIKHYLAKGIDYRSRVEHEDELDFEALIIDENHNIFTWSVYANKEKRGEDQFLVRVQPPIAAGSGFKFALAVMCNGRTAEKAVQVAIKLDPFSGGEVQVFDFPAKPEVPSVRPEHLKPKEEEKKDDPKAAEEKPKGKGKKEEPVKAA
jgi:hypothetical protein